MKRLISYLLSFVSMLMFTITVSAEKDINLMSDYRNLLWEGNTLYYNEDHGTLSFNDGIGKAYITFPVENTLGFWFYADMGNLQNKGTGYIDLSFLDKNNNIVKQFTTEENSGNGSFNRYQLGSSDEYAAVPEGAEKVQITLFFNKGEKSPYFRNLSLVLSDNRTVDTSSEDWTISGKLQIVQVEVSKTDHIVWIIFVILVAFGMFAVRKFMDKAKKIK